MKTKLLIYLAGILNSVAVVGAVFLIWKFHRDFPSQSAANTGTEELFLIHVRLLETTYYQVLPCLVALIVVANIALIGAAKATKRISKESF